jgi:CRISPR system Cascade subunit CasC
MKHLELHIIQSVPVACLNRDDLNSPKTAVFGGVQRARVSSQSWKSAIRKRTKESDFGNLFSGNRTRLMVGELVERLVKKNVVKDTAVVIAEHIAGIVETLDSKLDSKGYKKIKTAMFFSPAEYDALVDAVNENILRHAKEVHAAGAEDTSKRNDAEKKALEERRKNAVKALEKAFSAKAMKDAIKSVHLMDAGDIALFGRMVANDHSLTVEAASMFSHALSTHRAENEIDFFAAVDDLQPKEESGAAITSTLEYNSATYYRFAALNLDMLADEDHLQSLTAAKRKSVVRSFLEATITAIPVARKNSMNANTLPDYVFGVVREQGHPIQLVNAFETPVRSSNGYVNSSIDLLKKEYKKLATKWNIAAAHTAAIPEVNLDTFLDGMVQHVV